ncbi:unnamed protein product [Pylaiella littoralis]
MARPATLCWATSMVASVFAASSASAFVSCPSRGGNPLRQGITTAQRTAFPTAAGSLRSRSSIRDYSSRRSSSSSSSSTGFGSGAVLTATARGRAGWVSSARSPLFPAAVAAAAAAAVAEAGTKTRDSSTSVSGTRLELDTECAGKTHTYEIVFVRHGQSTWNKANRFIGWTDAELTEEGEVEARVAGKVLLSQGFRFDIVYTSMLKRAIKTAWVVLDELTQQYVPVSPNWHLNERCYGALTGMEKKECVRSFGAKQVKTWRRSWDVPPPPIDKSSKLWPGNDPKYAFLTKDGESQVPLHESLKDVMGRSSVCWDEVIAPAIRAGKRVCVCGHENNLRSLLKYVDGVSDTDIMHVEVPRAVPLVYYLDENLQPMKLAGSAPHISGQYVGDPEEIAAIQERDLKNVYDLSVSANLEEAEAPRFATKLDEAARVVSRDGGRER